LQSKHNDDIPDAEPVNRLHSRHVIRVGSRYSFHRKTSVPIHFAIKDLYILV